MAGGAVLAMSPRPHANGTDLARPGHCAALDGVRGIAILAVVLFHARVPGFGGGYLGVDIFFVLSGFLITSALMDEQARTGRIRYGRFLWRRATRLMPALAVFLAAYLVLAPLFWPQVHNHGWQVLISAVYLADYGVALWFVPQQISHQWSLSLEQHFYLFWPLILIAARPSPANALRWLLVAWVLTTAWRVECLLAGQSWHQVYYRFDTRLSGLTLGAALAALRAMGRWPAMSGGPATCLAVAAALILMVQMPWRWPPAIIFGVTAVEGATVLLIIVALSQGTLGARLLAWPPLAGLGRISYGLYLWHYPIFVYMRPELNGWVVMIAGGSLAFALAVLSFVTVERWGMKLRQPGVVVPGQGQHGSRIAHDTRQD